MIASVLAMIFAASTVVCMPQVLQDSNSQLRRGCLTHTYLSAVLHAKKGNKKTRERIIRALERLEEEKQHDRTERRSLVPVAPATARKKAR